VYQFYGFIPGFMNFIHFFFDDVEWTFNYTTHLLGRLTYLAYNVLHLVHYYTYFMGEATIKNGISKISYFLFNMFYNSMVDGYPGLDRLEVWQNFKHILASLWDENAAWDYIRISFREAIRYILRQR
jgi:hypothetical protein